MFYLGWFDQKTSEKLGSFVRDGRNDMGCFVRGVKRAFIALSGMVNLCGMFCLGWQKMA